MRRQASASRSYTQTSCSRPRRANAFLCGTGFRADFILGLVHLLGKQVGLVVKDRREGIVSCASPFPAPLPGKNLVTVFSNVHVFKVIFFFLKCNFLTFFQIG